MMRDSKHVTNIIKMFRESFPDQWVESLAWASEQESLDSCAQGLRKIKSVADATFVAFATLALSGDHLRFSTEGLDTLLEMLGSEIIEDEANGPKGKLQRRFQSFLEATKAATLLVKHHCNITANQFKVHSSTDEIFNVIGYSHDVQNTDSWVNVLDTILDVCSFEYRFSYNRTRIRELIIKREDLSFYQKKSSNPEIEKMISITISKIDLLLLKLSHFAKDKRIEYQFNFNKTVVSPLQSNFDESKEYANFLKFIDPQKHITTNDVYEWQSHKENNWAGMWQMVLLMRYYTNVTKDVQQADNLLNEYESFYSEKKKEMFYDFNRYALRSVRVYMHNCVLSLKCKVKNCLSFDGLKELMKNIQTIQNECFIYNYHPYQKAIEYTIELIDSDIKRKVQKCVLVDKFSQLKAWYEIYQRNIDWCREYQCYAFQLTFKECTKFDRKAPQEPKVFFPSSFSRPLKFHEIYQRKEKIGLRINRLEYEVDNYDDILALKSAQEKVEGMERKNMETMGLFVTVTTFLVGLLSIFIGNNGDVSIVEKMHYVITLGTILLLFVCIGYFVIGSSIKKQKPYIFGILSVVLLLILGIYFFKISPQQNIKSDNKETKSTRIEVSVEKLPSLEVKSVPVITSAPDTSK